MRCRHQSLAHISRRLRDSWVSGEQLSAAIQSPPSLLPDRLTPAPTLPYVSPPVPDEEKSGKLAQSASFSANDACRGMHLHTRCCLHIASGGCVLRSFSSKQQAIANFSPVCHALRDATHLHAHLPIPFKCILSCLYLAKDLLCVRNLAHTFSESDRDLRHASVETQVCTSSPLPTFTFGLAVRLLPTKPGVHAVKAGQTNPTCTLRSPYIRHLFVQCEVCELTGTTAQTSSKALPSPPLLLARNQPDHRASLLQTVSLVSWTKRISSSIWSRGTLSFVTERDVLVRHLVRSWSSFTFLHPDAAFYRTWNRIKALLAN